MVAPEKATRRTVFVEAVVSTLAAWCRKQSGVRRNLDALDRCGEQEVAHMANDLQLLPAQLRGMARRGPEAADLLLVRMKALHLDAEKLAKGEPAVMHDLQRACSLCRTKRRCRRELARDPENPVWREHCLNEDTLLALLGEDPVRH